MATTRVKKVCLFCEQGVEEIDYKEPPILRKFTSSYAKIVARKRSGTCAKHQRSLARAIKRARFMGLIAYTNR